MENAIKKQDDWDWTTSAFNKIRQWFAEEGCSVEDAFRLFDKDFDGLINKLDLEAFLLDVLHISDKEISGNRINKLFKLMDEYKRGTV